MPNEQDRLEAYSEERREDTERQNRQEGLFEKGARAMREAMLAALAEWMHSTKDTRLLDAVLTEVPLPAEPSAPQAVDAPPIEKQLSGKGGWGPKPNYKCTHISGDPISACRRPAITGCEACGVGRCALHADDPHLPPCITHEPSPVASEILARVEDALTECGFTDRQARVAAIGILDEYRPAPQVLGKEGE